MTRGGCEIGAHLHPWVNPPAEEEVSSRHSFACNLPADLLRRKLETLRDAITASFGVPPCVYKAGRYGIGPETASLLRELGFDADTSVVPHLDLSMEGGPDFRSMPDLPFVSRRGRRSRCRFRSISSAVPPRSGPALYSRLGTLPALRLPGIAARLGLLERLRLSPEGHELRRHAAADGGGAPAWAPALDAHVSQFQPAARRLAIFAYRA